MRPLSLQRVANWDVRGVWPSPSLCHSEDHGFKSRTSRKNNDISGALGKQVGFQIRPARFDSSAICHVVAIYNSCKGSSIMGWHEGAQWAGSSAGESLHGMQQTRVRFPPGPLVNWGGMPGGRVTFARRLWRVRFDSRPLHQGRVRWVRSSVLQTVTSRFDSALVHHHESGFFHAVIAPRRSSCVVCRRARFDSA